MCLLPIVSGKCPPSCNAHPFISITLVCWSTPCKHSFCNYEDSFFVLHTCNYFGSLLWIPTVVLPRLNDTIYVEWLTTLAICRLVWAITMDTGMSSIVCWTHKLARYSMMDTSCTTVHKPRNWNVSFEPTSCWLQFHAPFVPQTCYQPIYLCQITYSHTYWKKLWEWGKFLNNISYTHNWIVCASSLVQTEYLR